MRVMPAFTTARCEPCCCSEVLQQRIWHTEISESITFYGMCNLQVVVGVGELSDEFRTFFVTRLAAFWILVSEAFVS